MKQWISYALVLLLPAISAKSQVNQGITVQASKDTVSVRASLAEVKSNPGHDTIRVGGIMIINNHDGGRDNTRIIRDKEYRNARYRRNVRTQWFILDLGLDNYADKTIYYPNNYPAYAASPVYNIAPRTAAQGAVTASEFTLIPQKSVNVNIWIFMQRINLIKHVLNFQYGFGAEMYNFRYQNNITYVAGYQPTIIRDSVNFRKNKLFAEYLTIPLMLNISTDPEHPHKSVDLGFGVSGGLLFKSRTKQISELRGKVKHNEVFNLNTYRLALVGEIGIGSLKFYGSYSLSPLHQNDLEQYPFSIGIRLLDGF